MRKTQTITNDKVTSISKPKTIDVLMKGTAVLEKKSTIKSNVPKRSINYEQQKVSLQVHHKEYYIHV